MDVFDAQVHFNQLGSTSAALAAMDAVGVAALMYDEYAGLDDRGRVLPGHVLPNGELRPVNPNAEAAALYHPDRIGVLRRVNYRDPDLEAVVKLVAAAPYVKALRVLLRDEEDVAAFANGGFASLFSLADHYSLPVAILTLGRSELVERYARRFPHVRMIIDHCGVGSRNAELPKNMLELAQYPKIFVKWSHAPFVFSKMTYPYPDVIPLLKRTLDAFGPERIMWASDCTESAGFGTWAEALFYLRATTDCSAADKEWILGKTARSVLGWPARQTLHD